MIGGIAARVGLIAVAVLAASWFAYDLRALSLDAQGRAETRVARSAPQVVRALSLFAQAAHGNADPTPRLDEARFLLALGRPRRAADVLTAVTRTNVGNLQAWILLASATAESDPQRAAQANQQLRLLFGHPVGYSAEGASILTPTGVVELVPGRVIGDVELVHSLGKVTQFVGWAGTLTPQPAGGTSVIPPDEILIVSHGRFIAGGSPAVDRPDVARTYGATSGPVGFAINVPTTLLERAGRRPDIQVWGAVNGISSQISIECGRAPQAFGCGG